MVSLEPTFQQSHFQCLKKVKSWSIFEQCSIYFSWSFYSLNNGLSKVYSLLTFPHMVVLLLYCNYLCASPKAWIGLLFHIYTCGVYDQERDGKTGIWMVLENSRSIWKEYQDKRKNSHNISITSWYILPLKLVMYFLFWINSNSNSNAKWNKWALKYRLYNVQTKLEIIIGKLNKVKQREKYRKVKSWKKHSISTLSDHPVAL